MSTMDTTGFSQVGRYGTLSLLKRNDHNAVVTSFGIDNEQLTFGRDPACDVRLYYPEVALVHCKVVFEERKAFLLVLGASGVLVDGCKVYPNSSPTASPVTVPLANNSEIEIHNKRFGFTYPPKDMRAVLFSTPSRPSNRALRLSMIQSAQVFSPRPSHDPKENLRILQSPIKNTFGSPSKPSLLSRPPSTFSAPKEDDEEDEEEEEGEDIILVDGNCPRVVQEERDLVILEDIEVRSRTPTPSSSSLQVQQPQPQYQMPQTPRRSLSRNTLHRAVLIRSAHKAVIKAEKEREEQEEELEVLDLTVAAADVSEEEDVAPGQEYVNDDDSTEEEQDEEEEGENNQDARKPLWKKSLERIWPFRSSSPAKEEEKEVELPVSDPESDSDDEIENKGEADEEEHHDEQYEQPAPLPSRPLQTPVRRPLGTFMTPQPQGQMRRTLFPRASSNVPQSAVGAGRYSMGGGGAQRVVVEPSWRVKDIVVPPADREAHATPAGASTPVRQMPQTSPMRPPIVRQRLSEEERKAIQERRRSALREPDRFFAGGVPGMTPSRATPAFRASISPTKAGSNTDRPSSPIKSEQPRSVNADDDDEELDTRTLLERMKETVEGMKRRRSMAPVFNAESGGSTPDSSVQSTSTSDLEFTSKHTTPRSSNQATSASSEHSAPGPSAYNSRAEKPKGDTYSTPRASLGLGVPQNVGSGTSDEDVHVDEFTEELKKDEEVFSLLRPGARDEGFVRRQSVIVLERPEIQQKASVTKDSDAVQDGILAPSIVIDGAPADELISTDIQDEKEVKSKGRARFLRAKKSPALETADIDEDNDEEETRLKANTRRAARSRTPQRPAEEIAVEPIVQESDPVIPKSAPRRTRKATTEPEDAPNVAPKRSTRKATTEPEEPVQPSAPAKRGRKPTVEPEEQKSVVEKEKAPIRRGRKLAVQAEVDGEEPATTITPAPAKRGRKAATPVSEPAPNTAEPVAKGLTPKTVPTRKPRSIKPKTAAVIVENDDDDPLDSIGDVELPAPAPKPTRGRKKAAVKEEPQDIPAADLPVAPVAGKSSRSKSAAAATKTPATKPRTAKKTPATAPAAVDDKENAPRSPTESDKASIADQDEVVPTKTRVSRTKASKAPVGSSTQKDGKLKEGESNEDEPSRGRTMRTRTRVKAS